MPEYDPFQRPSLDFGTLPQCSTDDIQQHYNDTCAIRCQEIILRDYGINLPEDFCVQEATSNGWYEPGEGTGMTDIGNILELHGVPVQQCTNANIYNLVNELGQGHRIIVGVDSGELWEETSFLHDIAEFFVPSGADHALIVSKIDVSDPDNVRVILTDPGTGDVAKEYSLEEFQDAWEDSNCFMVSTLVPPPANIQLPEMSGFDYSIGHISQAFNMPWNDFQFACDQYNLMNLVPGTEMFNDYSSLMGEGSTDWSLYDAIQTDNNSMDFQFTFNDSNDSFPNPELASDGLSVDLSNDLDNDFANDLVNDLNNDFANDLNNDVAIDSAIVAGDDAGNDFSGDLPDDFTDISFS